VLVLYGEEAPVTKPDCVRATARRFGLDPDPFEKIFAFRASEYETPSEKEANDIFGAYMEQIDRIIQVVDEFPQAEDSGELK
jgi:hypothetical protein